MKKILITGGAGYIGSHTAHLLSQHGYELVMVDIFHHGQQNPLPNIPCYPINIGDRQALEKLFQEHSFDAVMHFAAYIEVGESVKTPDRFYHNNVVNTYTLLEVMRKFGVNNIIFSSTCAIYGNPVQIPMDETHPIAPQSPYAKTKCTVEFMLQDYAIAYGLKYIALRYFNAAGAMPENNLGEVHNPETHAIPLLLQAAKNNAPFTIFGTDYPTPDGTAIRDYVHVLDIAQAHVLALEYLKNNNPSTAFNLGTGTGCSVKELVAVAEKISKKTIPVVFTPRRPGDVPILVANAHKAKTVLNWHPAHSVLEAIMQSAWAWEQKRF